MKRFNLSLIATVTAFALSSAAIADDHSGNKDMTEKDMTMPKNMDDGSWATFSGEVKMTMPDAFILDYGEGELTVEVDDGDFDNDAYKFLEGDQVTVTGRIDQNMLVETTLEAASIYVAGLNTTFFSSSVDEEEVRPYISAYAPMTVSEITLVGNVSETSDLMNTLSLEVGDEDVEIDLEMLGYDPLDDNGWLKVEDGDRVKITAIVSDAFFEDYDLDAQTLTKISD